VQNNVLNKIKVSHIFVLSHSRHIVPYVGFIRNDLTHKSIEHGVIIYTNDAPQLFDGLQGDDLTITNQRSDVVNIIRSANSQHKVVLHGIYDNLLLLSLLFNLKALQHVIWSMWGADVYYDLPKGIKGAIIKLARQWVLPRIGTKIGLKGDFTYLQTLTHHTCKSFVEIGFPAWFYDLENKPSVSLRQTKPKKLNAMIGNSGDKKNNYPAVIDFIAQSSLFYSLTFVLNYGATEEQISHIKAYATEKLINVDLIFLTEKCEYIDFIQLVRNHDALIYNHDRQQGVGTLNIASEYGLELFIPKHNPLFSTYSNWNICLHNTHAIPTMNISDMMTEEQVVNNQNYIRNIFHPKICAQKLNKLFLGDRN
jgi:dTDP-N-acetylfucosamine:lipid II N-acetylfucosaminyltransferase